MCSITLVSFLHIGRFNEPSTAWSLYVSYILFCYRLYLHSYTIYLSAVIHSNPISLPHVRLMRNHLSSRNRQRPREGNPRLRPPNWTRSRKLVHDRALVVFRPLPASRPQRTNLLMSAGIKYANLHSLPAYNTSSVSRLKSLYSDVSRQKHSNPAAYRSTVHWWREVLQTAALKHWLPQSSDTLVLHALRTLADSFRYEGAGKPLCLATVIVSSLDSIFSDAS